MTGETSLMLVFILLLVWLGISGFRRMKCLSDISIYRMSGIGAIKHKAATKQRPDEDGIINTSDRD